MDYRVIKENNVFLLTDPAGDIPAAQQPQQGFGLYGGDTRFMSCMELRINGEKPIVLASEADRNYVSTILLTNPHMERNGEVRLWRESIELERERFIFGGILYETIQASNFSSCAHSFDLSLRIDADFADMFAVRGFMGGELGSKRETAVAADGRGMIFSYTGLDGMRCELRVEWSKDCEGEIGQDGEVVFRLTLAAGEKQRLQFFFTPVTEDAVPQKRGRAEALEELRQSYEEWNRRSTSVESDYPLYDALYRRGLQDIRVLLTDIGCGSFPVAGLPWSAFPFARDSLIAALQLLPIHPEVAKGTLLTMARYQGEKTDAWRDEQPGKIMHELRTGELSRTNQVPFSPYYGSVDATPLFLLLLGEYVKWTGDTVTMNKLMPNVLRALDWITRYGQRDGSCFVSYYLESAKGIANQGWKDSADSIVHSGGGFAEAPIALVEVQGYVYQAKSTLAALFRSMPEDGGEYSWLALATQLAEEADRLKERFEAEFWMEEEGTYAIALDRDGRQVRSVTSNPGHLLMTGICRPERAESVASSLVSPRMFSGYGIRTMAEGETGYNPMSYHDGSVWPHDNSIGLMGLNAGGFREEAGVVMEGLLRAAGHFENNRLPELFCGYSSDRGKPVGYPVACSPQAWAAAAPLSFVPAMLGLRIDWERRTVHVKPALPEGMSRIEVRGMRLGSGRIDLNARRKGDGADGYEIELLAAPSEWTFVLE